MSTPPPPPPRRRATDEPSSDKRQPLSSEAEEPDAPDEEPEEDAPDEGPPSEEEAAEPKKKGKKKKKKALKSGEPKEPRKPASYDKASPEIRAYMDQLQEDEQEAIRYDKQLLGVLGVCLLLLLLVWWGVRRGSTGSYAALDDIQVEQNPIDEGRFDIKFNVTRPGKVFFERASGAFKAERTDTFESPGEVERSWSWYYQPGKNAELTIHYRSGIFHKTFTKSFPTSSSVDVVVLMDTTPTMDSSIEQLQKECFKFSDLVEKRGLHVRYALLGFGDRNERLWFDQCPLTNDDKKFHDAVVKLRRFEGGDIPDSALDALEKALELKFDGKSNRRFYLVTDAPYQEPTRSGATAETIAEELKKRRVMLRVFSILEFKASYEKLLGDTGRFMPLQTFGQVLGEARVLGE
jgi:hypothetical protein